MSYKMLETRLLYRTLLKEVKRVCPRKLQRESKMKEFRFLFDQGLKYKEKDYPEFLMQMKEIALRMQDGTLNPMPVIERAV